MESQVAIIYMKILQRCINAFLFLLPWPTIYITREVFLHGAKWQAGTMGFFATEILLWSCISIFVFLYLKKIREIKIQKIEFTWSVDRVFVLSLLLFLLYCMASALWSSERQLAQQQSLHILEACLFFLVLYLAPIDRVQATKYFIVGAVVQSVLGIFQFLTQSTFSYKWLGLVAHPVQELGTSVIAGEGIGRVLRAYAAFSHPNVFAGYLVVAIFCTVFLLLQERKNNFLKFAFSLELIALFFTFSRAAWIVVILFFLGCEIVSRMRRVEWYSFLQKLCSVALVLFCLLSMLYWPLIHTRISHDSRLEIQSTEERVTGYKEAFQIWKQAPWLGVGAGNYTVALSQVHPNQPGYMYQPVHNVPLLFGAEFGLVGVMLLFGVLITFYRFSLQNSHQKYQMLFLTVLFFLFFLFDHYLFSSFVGLMLCAFSFSVFSNLPLNIGKK